ncbi:Voltage-gated sodium channel subunit [hydrothermal vent metagenome]|uniref:Voltage-gated sodium channel subunit n=1 Tax=hydrothermal vent metagenome TaxID=652676 RepID=A0A3B0WY66_9ZZZZ
MLQKKIFKFVHSSLFEKTIIGLILLNAVVLGLETDAGLRLSYGEWFEFMQNMVLLVFIVEFLLKIIAVTPRLMLYFGNGWNLFDFSIIVLSLVPATGELAIIARLARLLRVLRLVSAIPELRLIVTTLMRSIPSMGHIVMLMSIIFYIYAIAGYHLFHAHDPQHWGNLGVSILTLFRVVTLEDWTDLMYTALELHEWAWIYFVSFIFVGTFVIINLFIAVVLNNLEKSKAEALEELREDLHQPVTRKDLLKELAETQQALIRLRKSIEKVE